MNVLDWIVVLLAGWSAGGILRDLLGLDPASRQLHRIALQQRQRAERKSREAKLDEIVNEDLSKL